MADRLNIEICGPAFRPVSIDAESVIVPGEAGVFTVLPGHTPLLTTLTSGVLVVRESEEKKHFYAVHGGFAEVRNNHVRILADTVEPAATIDRHAARAELERAVEGMRKPGAYPDSATAERAAIQSRARVQAADQQEF